MENLRHPPVAVDDGLHGDVHHLPLELPVVELLALGSRDSRVD